MHFPPLVVTPRLPRHTKTTRHDIKKNLNKLYQLISSPVFLWPGHWVFLANCHLSLSWMPELDKLVEQLQVQQPHPNFRLWLSSSPHPEFPVTILQAGIKMTTEPPKVRVLTRTDFHLIYLLYRHIIHDLHGNKVKVHSVNTAPCCPQGVKANMKRLYQLVTEDQFNRCSRPVFYRKLLFSLCFFHSILLERKKFLQLGWNIVYGFNDSDFEVRSGVRKKQSRNRKISLLFSVVATEWWKWLTRIYCRCFACQ